MPPVPEDAVPLPTLGERAGDVIDRYELRREIGEGGMGTVWLAQQSEPVRREVALEVIKLGMDTREVVARFEAERQALALMDHPNIAKVLDGGATSSGRPYFVMEHVAGRPITEYCDEVRLGVRERLALVKACDGIQHAHQKGVIHRDIKPGNVLVTLQDGRPVPKVIDFGIAKATGAALTQHTLATEAGQMLGTPEFMAPEQLGLSGLDIDTRADVYSLGVLLYELLTGTKPFDLRQVIASGYDELLRTIREVDPDRPSTRITRVGARATAIAADRRVDPTVLGRDLGGDLDWIVMRALEKDRERRYDTANDLAADVERFLNDEPVVAAPPSATYLARKFVRRHKRTVAAVAAILLLLVAGSIGTGVGLWRTVQANRSLDRALDEKDQALAQEARQRELAQTNERRAREAEAESQARSADLERVVEFQAAQLGQISPERMGARIRQSLLAAATDDRGEELVAALAAVNFTDLALDALESNLFGNTLEAIDSSFGNQPLVRADLLSTLADTLAELGLLESARSPGELALAIRRSELGDDHPGTLDALDGLARILEAQGSPSEAEPLYREALDGRRRVLGDDHPDTLTSVNNLGAMLLERGDLDQAGPLLREALEGLRLVLGHDPPTTLAAIGNTGNLLQAQGDPATAEPYYREVLDSHRRVKGDDHPTTLIAVSNLSGLLLEQGKLKEAAPLAREALAACRRVHGDLHPDTIWAMLDMGYLHQELGEASRAEALYREALDGSRRSRGDDHPNTRSALRALRILLEDQERWAEALQVHGELLASLRRVRGADDPDTIAAISGSGALHLRLGDLAAAEACFREALLCLERTRGTDHPDTLVTVRNLRGTLDLSIQQARSDHDLRALGLALARLGALDLDQGRPAEAEESLREALEALRPDGTEDDPLPWQISSDLGLSLAAQGRNEEAEPLLRRSAEWMVNSTPASRLRAASCTSATGVAPPTVVVQRLIDLHDALHLLDPAAGHDRRAETWRSVQATWIAGMVPR